MLSSPITSTDSPFYQQSFVSRNVRKLSHQNWVSLRKTISDTARSDGSRIVQIQNSCIKCKTRRWMLLSPQEPLLLLHSHSKPYTANGSRATGMGMRKLHLPLDSETVGSPPSPLLCSFMLIQKYLAGQAYWYFCNCISGINFLLLRVMRTRQQQN